MRRALFLTALLLAACGGREAPPPLRLATTTSLENSGLLAGILPAFTKETGIRVDVLAMGSGKAVETARRGDCDLLLAHAPAMEEKFVAEGFGIERRYLMWNDFLIVGPPDDPAGVRGLGDAAAALGKIAAAKAPFCSRGDDSGTHQKEKELWMAAGVAPGGAWYRSLGQGMEATLRVAFEMRAYTLTDRGTWLAVRKGLDLTALCEGDRRLSNPYHVLLVNPARHPHVQIDPARRLAGWLAGPEGQKRIGAFLVDGEALFHPAAGGD